MPISNTNPQPNDVVILQRNAANTYYGETHISGSSLILYIDSTGSLNADKSASFYSIFIPTFAYSSSYVSGSHGVITNLLTSTISGSDVIISSSIGKTDLNSSTVNIFGNGQNLDFIETSIYGSLTTHSINFYTFGTNIDSQWPYTNQMPCGTMRFFDNGNATGLYMFNVGPGGNTLFSTQQVGVMSVGCVNGIIPWQPGFKPNKGVVIGIDYTTGSFTIPNNGLIVQGKVGIGLINTTNSLDVSGNISCSVITASLFGTSSYTVSASYSSYANSSLSASWASSSLVLTASVALQAISSSYALSASWASNGGGSSVSASWASSSISSSYAITASYSLSSSIVNISFISSSLSSSWASQSLSASWAPALPPVFNYQTGSYTLQNNDMSYEIVVNSPVFSILTIPSGLSSSFYCSIYQSGSGRVFFTGSLGVNIRSINNIYSSAGQGSLVNISTGQSGEYILSGELDYFDAQLVGWEDFSTFPVGYYANTTSSATLWASPPTISGSFYIGSIFPIRFSQSANYLRMTASNFYMGKMYNGNNYNVVRVGMLCSLTPNGTGNIAGALYCGVQTGSIKGDSTTGQLQNSFYTYMSNAAPDFAYVNAPDAYYTDAPGGGHNYSTGSYIAASNNIGMGWGTSLSGIPAFLSFPYRRGFLGIQFNKSGSSVWALYAYQGCGDIDYTYSDLRNWLETGKMGKQFSRSTSPLYWTTTITESYGALDSAMFFWDRTNSAPASPFIVYAVGASNYIY